MIAGLREAKLSSNRKVKVGFFPGAKTEDLISNLKKKSPTTSLFILGRMMGHVKMKTSFMKNSTKSKI